MTITLTIDQKRSLLSAIETIHKGYSPFLYMTEDEQAIKFIDQVFCEPACLKEAWHTPGFPFIHLNEIYKGLTGRDHPVFVELFKYSFVSGTYQAEAEKIDSCDHFSLIDVKYFGSGQPIASRP